MGEWRVCELKGQSFFFRHTIPLSLYSFLTHRDLLSLLRLLPEYGLNLDLGARHAGHLPFHAANASPLLSLGRYSQPQSMQM